MNFKIVRKASIKKHFGDKRIILHTLHNIITENLLRRISASLVTSVCLTTSTKTDQTQFENATNTNL